MTSINTALSSYYSLSGQSSGQTSGATTSAGSLTQTLADALSQVDSSSDSSSSDAYSLNLSPTAQQLMSTATSSVSGTSTKYSLTTEQQTAITSILEKYKDAPFTQTTFNEIQDDLSAAGLGSNQLSLEDNVKNFSPTSVLLSALGGNYTNLSSVSGTSSTQESTKASNYMQSIISQWKSLSTTASSTSDTPSS